MTVTAVQPRRHGTRSGVVFAVTDAVTAHSFLRPHLEATLERGSDTFLVAGESETLYAVAAETGAQARPLKMARMPDPPRDLLALVSAIRLVRRIRPRATHVGTPKAGLIVGLAAAVCRVPIRLYVVHGLRFATATGWRRQVLMMIERISCLVATRVISVSESVAQDLIRLGLAPTRKIRVLGSGSISGVDIQRFAHCDAKAEAVRREYGIRLQDRLALFVGRLSEDKGLRELALAWAKVADARRDCRLLVVGDLDVSQPPAPEVLEYLCSQPSITLTGALSDTSSVYSAADFLVLPTYREGFGTVILEAAAAGVPAVATRVTGCIDAVIDGRTGVLVQPRDIDSLSDAILVLLDDAQFRRKLGDRARARVEKEFNPGEVVDRYIAELFPS